VVVTTRHTSRQCCTMLNSHRINSHPMKLIVKEPIHAGPRFPGAASKKSLSHLAGLFIFGSGSLILTITPDPLADFPCHGR